MKPPSETASTYWRPSPGKTRYLLKQGGNWIADHALVSDATTPFTDNPDLALQFASHEAAFTRLAMIRHLFSDLEIDAVILPLAK